ncbi:MAG: hypothetical protein WC091_18135 [Sulfuricellaceae bacterium]
MTPMPSPITRNPAPTPRPPGGANTQRRKIWNAMRIQGAFSLDDLAGAVLDGAETARHPENSIRNYLYTLAATGYLTKTKRRRKSEPPRWLLTRNTGPHAPIPRPNGDAWDPNEARLYLREDRHA